MGKTILLSAIPGQGWHETLRLIEGKNELFKLLKGLKVKTDLFTPLHP